MLCLTNITKKYKEKLALDDVSLELAPGIYGLLGPNGAGKSTLMNIVTGNLKPDGGQVLWDGKEIKSLGAQYRSIIGYAPQQQGLYDAFTGKRFLAYMATLKGISKKEMPEEIARVLSYEYDGSCKPSDRYLFRWHETAYFDRAGHIRGSEAYCVG